MSCSTQVQTAVCARMDANVETRAESKAMLRNGQAPMTRLTLKRVGYDDKFQAALLKLHARNKMVSLEEDVEDFEEEDDNS